MGWVDKDYCSWPVLYVRRSGQQVFNLHVRIDLCYVGTYATTSACCIYTLSWLRDDRICMHGWMCGSEEDAWGFDDYFKLEGSYHCGFIHIHSKRSWWRMSKIRAILPQPRQADDWCLPAARSLSSSWKAHWQASYKLGHQPPRSSFLPADALALALALVLPYLLI